MSKLSYTFTTFLGVAAPMAGRIVSNLDHVEQWLRISSLGVGVAVGAASFVISMIKLIEWFKNRKRDRDTKSRETIGALAVASLLILAGSGCTFAGKSQVRSSTELAGVQGRIEEQSKALTTAGVDTLSLAPTNEFTNLALELAKRDQLLEGLPQERIDVAGVLAGNEAAVKALTERYKIQAQLIQEKSAVEAKLRETEARLVEMGKKYEEEKNRSIVKRIWFWAKGTLGLGGLIALCIFFPVLIPIFARAAAWLVTRLPKLAGAIGVVSTKAFDAVVKGVELGQKEAGEYGAGKLKFELSKAMDAAHKQLVRARKPIVVQPA